MRVLIQRVKSLLQYQDRVALVILFLFLILFTSSSLFQETKLPNFMKSGNSLELLLDQVHEMAPMPLGNLERELGLQDTAQVTELGDQLYSLFQYEKILDRVEKYLVAISEQSNKSKISIAEVHDSLTKLTSEVAPEQYSMGSSVYPLLMLIY